jgi:hypothetical protein
VCGSSSGREGDTDCSAARHYRLNCNPFPEALSLPALGQLMLLPILAVELDHSRLQQLLLGILHPGDHRRRVGRRIWWWW